MNDLEWLDAMAQADLVRRGEGVGVLSQAHLFDEHHGRLSEFGESR